MRGLFALFLVSVMIMTSSVPVLAAEPLPEDSEVSAVSVTSEEKTQAAGEISGTPENAGNSETPEPSQNTDDSGMSEASEAQIQPGDPADVSLDDLSEEPDEVSEAPEENVDAPEESALDEEMETAEDPSADPYDPENFTVSVDESSVDRENGSFVVVLSGPIPKNAVKVEFPAWSADGQKDLYWYQKNVEKDPKTGLPKTRYKARIRISNHNYNQGRYVVHAYLTDKKGVRHYVGKAFQIMESSCGNIVVRASEDEMKAALYAQDVVVPGGAEDITFAVWSKNKDQDDLKWYSYTSLTSYGSYKASAVIKNHGDAGVYNVHAYAKLKNGSMVFLGKTKFTVSGPSARLVTNAVSGKKGTFGAIGTDFDSPSGISKVRFAVWCADDQSDIYWYTAGKQKDGNYTQVISVANHKYHFGKYKVHMYVTTGNGITKNAGRTTVEIKADNYVYVQKIGSAGTSVKVTIVNPNLDGAAVTSVKMPTWSKENEQDDIKWYAASKSGNTWSCVVDSLKHKHSGLYYTHVYNQDNVRIGRISYQLNADPVRAKAIARLEKQGKSLRAAYDWAVAIPYRVTDTNRNAPWYADYGFTNSTGNCYVKAAVFAYMARELGYKADVISGGVPLRRGGIGPHGWVEIVVDGSTYICDPDFQSETGRNGYMIHYGQSGTWKYIRHGVLQ